METAGTNIGKREGQLLTLQEAADYLHVSLSTIKRLVRDGELRAFRIRRSWRTSTFACDEYIDSRFEEAASTCQSVMIR